MSTISLCMIVKNEGKNLARCLASVKAFVDEMIVVDTGSNDNTIEIAQQFGAKVSYFQWCDDFAAARNYALSLVTGDWVLVLDADEELVVKSADFLERLAAQPQYWGYTLSLTDIYERHLIPANLLRLFRHTAEIQYKGRFHEAPTISTEKISHLDSLSLLHYGYRQDSKQQKNLYRNIPLLEKARQDEGLNLTLLYCLAGMYTHAQREDRAQECYAEAFERLLPNLLEGYPPDRLTFIPSLINVLGARALVAQDYETTILLCQQGLKWYPNFPPLIYLAGITLRAIGFLLGATTYLQKCIELGQTGSYDQEEPFERSYMTTSPAYDLGNIYLELGDREQARIAFQLALSFDPNFTLALERVSELETPSI